MEPVIYGEGESRSGWCVLTLGDTLEGEVFDTKSAAERHAREKYLRFLELAKGEVRAYWKRRGRRAFAQAVKVEVTLRLARE